MPIVTEESNVRYVKLKEHKAGDKLVSGKYLGNYEGQYGTNYKFEDGEDRVAVLGHKNIDARMSKIPVGAIVS